MILGNCCTRGCGFCSVPKGNPGQARHAPRPGRARQRRRAWPPAMQLRYVVITSVNRDDLADGGSHHFAETVREVRRALPDARVEVLTPDFCGDLDAVARVLDAGPHVFNHNMETVAAPLPPRAPAGRLPPVARRAGVRAPLPAAVADQIRLHGRAWARPPTRSTRFSATSARRRYRRGHHRPVSPAHAPQPAGGRVHRARAVRRVPRLRPVARFQGRSSAGRWCAARTWPTRSARKRDGAVLNWLLALASAALLILTFPRFQHRLARALRAHSAAGRAGARKRGSAAPFLLGWTAGIVYWFGVCYWIQFVLAVHGGVGEVGPAGRLLLLFCCAKALHWPSSRFSPACSCGRWWAVPAVAALWVRSRGPTARSASPGSRSATRASTWRCPLRLAPFTGVYGLSFLFALMATAVALVALRRPRIELAPLLVLPLAAALPPLPEAQRGSETAVLAQPNISETEEWTPVSVDRMHRRMLSLSLRAALSSPQPPQLVIWPEVPPPLYYYEDAASAPRSRTWPAAPTRICSSSWPPTPRRRAPQRRPPDLAPGPPDQPLRQGEPGAVRRVRPVAVRRWQTKFRPRSATSPPAKSRWFSPSETTGSALSSATSRCSRISSAASRSRAPRCWSTFRTTAGSARAPRACSTSRSSACAPPKTAAGFFARPTTASPRPSIPPVVCTAFYPPTRRLQYKLVSRTNPI